MDPELYSNSIQSTANQPLGGKEMRFPYGGMSIVSDYNHFGNKYTVSSVNVILRSPYNWNRCGGTRPGLKPVTGIISESGGQWMWPNGDKIMWPDGNNISFVNSCTKYTSPDGVTMLNPHEVFNVRASKGSVPANCTVMAMYRARLVVAKDSMWYASRAGAIDDFDYGGDFQDVSRAAAGNVSLAGTQGDEITALAAIYDKWMVIATKRSLWCVTGEVTSQNNIISDNIGIISRFAWCYDGIRFWFISTNGLYSMTFGEPPVNMTQHLDGVFSGWSSAVMIYDVERNGIHIIGTKSGTGSPPSDWFYDIANGAMWEQSYPSAIRPTSGYSAINNGKHCVIFRCADDSWKCWDETQETDDGTSIVSALAVGPIVHTTGDTENSFLAELDCEMDTRICGNGTFNVSGVVGNTSDSASKRSCDLVSWIRGGASGTDSNEKFRYSFSSGWNKVKRPRVRCNSFSAVVWSTSNRWAISKITAVSRGCGRIRG